jgi:hypothetical protein
VVALVVDVRIVKTASARAQGEAEMAMLMAAAD